METSCLTMRWVTSHGFAPTVCSAFPSLPNDHRRRLRTALAIACLAFACEGFAFTAYFTTGSLERPPSLPLVAAVAAVGIGWPLSALLMYGLLALAQWLRRTARRTGQPSLQESLWLDDRAPI